MKLGILYIAIISVLLFSFSVSNVNANNAFEYSVYPGTDEWESFTSRDEMITALRIPDYVLKNMTTEELVEALFDYPLIGNLIVYNDNQTALREFEKICDAFSELITRDDAAEVLSNRILTLNDFIKISAGEVLLSSEKIYGS